MKKVFLLFFLVVIAVGCGEKNHSKYDKPYGNSKKWSYTNYLEKYPDGFYSCYARYRLGDLSQTENIEALDRFIAAGLRVKSLSPEDSRRKYGDSCKQYIKMAWNHIARLVVNIYMAKKVNTGNRQWKQYVLNTDIEKINMVNDHRTLTGKAVLFENNGLSLNERLPETNRAKTYSEAQILILLVNEHVKVGFGENAILVSFERIDSTVIFIDLERNKIIGKEIFMGENPPSRGKVDASYGLPSGIIIGKKCPYVYDFIASMFKKNDRRDKPHTVQPWEKYAWQGWRISVCKALSDVPFGKSIIVPSLHGGFTEVSMKTLEKVIDSQRPEMKQ